MPEEKVKKGHYLYAVVSNAEEKDYGAIGIDDGVVYHISDSVVSAVVSDIANRKLRPERRNLAAHQGVLRFLMEETTPLPMTFGVVADSIEAVRKILSLNQNIFIEQLRNVANKVEMGLRVAWDVQNIFEYFVHVHPDLRILRDRLFGRSQTINQNDKIELGRRFEQLLNEDRETYTNQVVNALEQSCVEIKRNNCRNEEEVMNLACLVERDMQKSFENGIFDASKFFDNNFAFDFNGPWAPHNFVDIDLKVDSQE
ncbi:MAG: GvpL/GvpF family gas vesicle protein [Candidatus Hatepunaea meridiana]|nr:GvpL/GvpF family gas vesicle protein [Candidatus Hatepunaea meridiana]